MFFVFQRRPRVYIRTSALTLREALTLVAGCRERGYTATMGVY